MTIYAVHVQVITRDGAYEGSRSVPTFYLDSRVQGIVSEEHAASVAAGVVNPLGIIAADDLHISAVPVDTPLADRVLAACSRAVPGAAG